MQMPDVEALVDGARNLLLNCAGLKTGQRVAVVAEDPTLGWYDADAPRAVVAEAEALGAEALLLPTGDPADGLTPEAEVLIAQYDLTIFFARIGDQNRFAERPTDQVVVMSYARTAAALASNFGRLNHRAVVALKTGVDAVLGAARRIEMRCPLGTHVTAELPGRPVTETGEVSVRRFPLGVPRPVDAGPFTGQVVLARYLTPTGSRTYVPAALELSKLGSKRDDALVTAEIRDGRIQRFRGPVVSVAAVEAHYTHVAGLFGIDAWAVHSWHAGLHPGCGHDRPADEDPDLWSNTVFNSPAFAHFHTCGAYAPGEICWMVAFPTISVDGRPLWKKGKLEPGSFVALADIVAQWPDLSHALEDACPYLGL